MDSGERIVVGVNDYVADEPVAIPILAMDPTATSGRSPGYAACVPSGTTARSRRRWPVCVMRRATKRPI